MGAQHAGPQSSAGELVELVTAAAGGSQLAWSSLVDRFAGLLWSICRSYGLDSADAADVFQLTWLRLLEHLDSIADPTRLPGWLATTCRRECLALLRRGRRVQPTADAYLLDRFAGSTPQPDHASLLSDRDAELWRAFGRLSQRCQQVLRVLVVDPEDGPPAYEAAAAALDMPVGSLGPTRARCLEQLRKLLDTYGISGATRDS